MGESFFDSFMKNAARTIVFPKKAERKSPAEVGPIDPDDWQSLISALLNKHAERIKTKGNGIVSFKFSNNAISINRHEDGSCVVEVAIQSRPTQFAISEAQAKHLDGLLLGKEASHG